MDHRGHPPVTIAERAALGSFRHVDAEPHAAALIAALDEQASLPAIQRLRATAAELLRPRLGDRLLDVGCGTGEVARTLAGLIGSGGTVVGVEPSVTMLDEARRRTGAHVPVDFRAGDISRLDFDDATFDGVTSERVFQHLDSPTNAIAELARVTKPGGRLVVIDTDCGRHAIHGADPAVTARIVTVWSDNAANGWSGRRLPAPVRRRRRRRQRSRGRRRDVHHDRSAATEHATVHDHGGCRRQRWCHHQCRSRVMAGRTRPRGDVRLRLLGRDDVRRRRRAALAERRNLRQEGGRPVSYFAVVRDAGPAWTDGKGAFEQPGADQHAAFMNALADEGIVLFAGPLAGSEHGRIHVLLIVHADNEAVIHDRFAADPWEQAQLLVTASVEPWNLFVGADRISVT
jgi:ubiquinone/menaquinone biosynthesis C-methylase UbiE/uncharacterized protein YciI